MALGLRIAGHARLWEGMTRSGQAIRRPAAGHSRRMLGLAAARQCATVGPGSGSLGPTTVAAALSAAVGALSGPLHGGAPSRVLTMLDEVEASGDAESWVSAALDRGDRLMGFGHRIYRTYDPRARILRELAKIHIGDILLETTEGQQLALRRVARPDAEQKRILAALQLEIGVEQSEVTSITNPSPEGSLRVIFGW